MISCTIRRSICIFWVVLFAAASAAAATLENYRERIANAQKNVEVMISIVESDARAAEYQNYLRETEAAIRSSLPETEKIEFDGSVIETSNGWLRSSFEKMHQKVSSADHVKELSAISERLSAIYIQITEMEAASAAQRSKDEDKQKLDEILRREEYQKPEEKQQSLFQQWLWWFIDWLRNIFPSASIQPVDASGLQPLSVVLQFLIYAAIIVLIGFVIFKFAPLIADRFRTRDKEPTSSRVILGEHIADSVSASDLFSQAEALARSGDLRGAIRKGYIALLCDLADRKIIGLSRSKTNRDYLRDIRKRASLFERVKRATGSFERHWYGFRKPGQQDWDDFTEHYRAAMNETRQ